MSVPILLFSALVLASTLVIVTSVVLFAAVLRTSDARWPRRLAMALLLPWGGLEVWRVGRRALPALWASSILAYVALRVATAAAAPFA
ncbi:MAG: hypothetical protein M5U28_03615 [Sandaracinaceae bacterium]|nr:hypothetical protein [Sandaracinaceae bacterium]